MDFKRFLKISGKKNLTRDLKKIDFFDLFYITLNISCLQSVFFVQKPVRSANPGIKKAAAKTFSAFTAAYLLLFNSSFRCCSIFPQDAASFEYTHF